MASGVYLSGINEIALGTIDLSADGDTIRALLVTDAYSPDFVNDEDVADVTNELTDSTYTDNGTNGRVTLTMSDSAVDSSNSVIKIDASDITWNTLNAGTVGGVVIFKAGASDASSTLIAFIDLSPNITTDGSNLTIQWSSDGVLTQGNA